MKLRISEGYLKGHGFFIDLGDDGDFVLDEAEVEVDPEFRQAYIVGEYRFAGWKFAPAEIILNLSAREVQQVIEENWADRIFYLPWDDFQIVPKENCCIRQYGDRDRRTLKELGVFSQLLK